ncbi:hypothetical protein ACIBF1_27695 [Spirillospora sp. NPDC050679]
MNATTPALAAVVLYYVGAALFKRAGARMPPLRGTRPLHLLGELARSPLWLAGLLVFAVGMELQIIAFAELPLGVAQPLFASTLLVLLWIGATCFGERLAPREWLGVGLFALSAVLVWASVRPGPRGIGSLPPAPLAVAVVVPSVLLTVLLFSRGDLRPAGRHARPLAGVAYGLGSGVALGAGEVAIKGLAVVNAARGQGPHPLATPYPYLVGLAVAVGLAQAMIAMQRCRMVVCVSVCTIAAKTYLVLVGSLLYGGDWPADPLWGAVRAAAVLLAAGAVAVFPRYESCPDGGPPYGPSSSPMTSSAVSISGRVPPR